MANEIVKYNPFYPLLQDNDCENFFNDEPPEYIENLQEMSDILEACKSYTVNEFCNLRQQLNQQHCADKKPVFSTYFENIDGNQANFDTFSAKMSTFDHKFSVIGIAETNVNEINKDSYKISDEYSSEYQSKIEGKSKGSGLALYVRNNYNFTVTQEFNYCNANIESLFIELTNTAVPITVGIIYRPPNGDLNSFNKDFELLLTKLPKNNCYILGDYNVDLHNLKSKSEKAYEEIVISNGFLPVISLSTHHQVGCKKSCIDNIITNQCPQKIVASGKLSSITTSHSGIFQISANIGLDEKPAVEKIKVEYDYSYDNIQNFKEELANILNQNTNGFDNFAEYIEKHQFGVDEKSEVGQKFENFVKLFKNSIDKTCKLSQPRLTKRNKINNPWITMGIIKSISTNDKLYQSWIESFKFHENGDDSLKDAHRNHQKTLRWTIKTAKRKYNCDRFEKNKGNKKKTWQIINEIRGKEKNKMKPSFVINNERIFMRRIIAEKFNKYFVKLASNLNEDAYGNIPITSYPSFESYLSRASDFSIFLEECTPMEIEKIIQELITGKSSDIPIVLIKASSKLISPYLSYMYTMCMSLGVFPNVFKLSRITPIYKKGNKELIENYRPISTLPIFGKIFEKVIYSRLYTYLISKGILKDSQFGFRKGYSTGHAIHHSLNIINEALKNKNHVMGIFIDLSKAFDTLDHTLLIKKLDNYGIRGTANDLLRSYLSDRKQYTSVFGEDSSVEPILYGVPQGSVLGPLLFLVYINDITNSIKHITGVELVLYADDTNIFFSSENKEKLIIMANNILNCINDYMKSNFLHVNNDKCCYMHFKPQIDLRQMDNVNYDHNNIDNDEHEVKIIINNCEVSEVESTKFLGVTIDNKLSWLPHIEILHKKLKSACSLLKRMRDNIPTEHYRSIYYALFESHLTYCITVFGNAHRNLTEKLFIIQKHCIRILFGDLEAFLDKHKTCSRTRSIENQRLGHEFYCKEHTKPLFYDQQILSFKNLYNYQICIETLKILKFKYPSCLYNLFTLSSRKNENILLGRPLQSNFVSTRLSTWNSCVKMIIKDGNLFEMNIPSFKNKIKTSLLTIQNAFDKYEWYPDLNFNIDSLKRIQPDSVVTM